MDKLKITKQPIIEEDLGLEDTSPIQWRDDKEEWVTPVKLFKIVDNLQQLRNVDFNKFKQSVVFGGEPTDVGNNTFYKWDSENTEVEQLPDIVTSELSETGRWVKQALGQDFDPKDFVTLDTEQEILASAKKVWKNQNLFQGYNEAGQITIIKDENSLNAMLTICDTTPELVLASVGFKDDQTKDFTIENNQDGEIVFNKDLNFTDGRHYINKVSIPVESHQATPKEYVDAADKHLQDQISILAATDENLQDQIDALESEYGSLVVKVEGIEQDVETNKQDIASNAQDIVENTTRIDELDDKISRITQTGVIIGQIQKTKDQVELDRVNILDAYVQERKGRTPLEGDSVYTTDSYGYHRGSTTWSDPYTITISIATTTTAGLVKSVDNVDGNRGKVKVESSSGEMSIVKGEQLPYMDLANTFLEDQTFNKKARVKGTFYTEGLAFLSGENDLYSLSTGVRDPADTNPDGADKLLEVWNYNSSGVPSRRKGKATYNKTVDIGSINRWEIVNMDALQRYVESQVPDDIARTSVMNSFEEENVFMKGITLTGGSLSATNIPANFGNVSANNLVARGQFYVSERAAYDKVLDRPDDSEIVNHGWLKKYVAEHGGGGSGAGGKTIATVSTIPYQGLYNGAFVYQEVDVDSTGNIVRYRDFFVRGFISSYMFNMAEGSDALKQRVPLPNDVEFERLYVGKHHMYAIPKAGEGRDTYMYSIGWNSSGQLGDGTTTNRYTSIEKIFDSRVKKVLPTQHGPTYSLTYVLLENGDLYVSGWDTAGQSGLGRTGSTTYWTRTRTGVKDVWSSALSVFALDFDGRSIYACGRNVEGQLGVGDYNEKLSWTRTSLSSSQLKGLKKFCTSFEAQGEYWCTSLALTSSGLYGCGRSVHGELGKLNVSTQNTFLEVPLNASLISVANIVDVASTPLLTILLHEKGVNTEVWTGGYGTYGHGDGSGSGNQNLTKVLTLIGKGWKILTNQKASFDGDKRDCIFIVNTEMEEVWAWGANDSGELGIGRLGTTYAATKIPMPAKSSFQFEVDVIFDPHTNVCSLLVVIDGTVFTCGSGVSRRVWNTTPILTAVN